MVKVSELNGVFASKEYAIPYPAVGLQQICEARPNRYQISFFVDNFTFPTLVTTLEDASGGGMSIPLGGPLTFKVTDFPGFVQNAFFLVANTMIGTIRVVETWQIDG